MTSEQTVRLELVVTALRQGLPVDFIEDSIIPLSKQILEGDPPLPSDIGNKESTGYDCLRCLFLIAVQSEAKKVGKNE